MALPCLAQILAAFVSLLKGAFASSVPVPSALELIASLEKFVHEVGAVSRVCIGSCF